MQGKCLSSILQCSSNKELDFHVAPRVPRSLAVKNVLPAYNEDLKTAQVQEEQFRRMETALLLLSSAKYETN